MGISGLSTSGVSEELAAHLQTLADRTAMPSDNGDPRFDPEVIGRFVALLKQQLGEQASTDLVKQILADINASDNPD
jgi:hypothetical protein